METVKVIQNRQLIESLIRVNLNDNKLRAPAIIVVFDNDLGLNTALHPTVWDDANERVIFFGTNSYDVQGSTAMGNSTIRNPANVTIVQYEQIQQMKIVLCEEDFDLFCDAIGIALIPDEMRSILRTKLFVLTDPEYAIKQRQKTHY